MLKIGDFSKLSLVSVRMLRHYEDMGLLEPIEVDRFTGYRYYSFEQLPRLNRILALKDLGFSLEQIAQILNEDLSAEQLRGMLRLKQAEIQQRLGEEQARLSRVAARLSQIEQENKMSTYDVILKKVEPLKVASLREVIHAPQEVGMQFQKLFVTLGQKGVRPCGPTYAIWHDAEYHEDNIDAEVAVPVMDSFAAVNGVRFVELPGVAAMACAIHRGPYEGISQAYTAVMTWVEINGYRLAGPMREIYLVGPAATPTDPSTYVTEIQFPVEKV